MLFREVKQGDTLYIFDKTAITLTQERVTNVTPPHADQRNLSAGMVVDVTIPNATYTFREGVETGYTQNLIISTNKANILREVETLKSNSETLLSRVDAIKDEIVKLDTIIGTLSPERQQKKEQEERMAKLEDGIASLKGMVELLIKQKNGTN